MKVKARLKFAGTEFKGKIYFGGKYCTKRAHRVARPLSTKYPIHLVIGSSKAVGDKSFWKKENKVFINESLRKHAGKWGVQVKNCANVGNHLHLFIKLNNLKTYERFVRAFCGALSLKFTGWNKNKGVNAEKFFDYRPYTRIVVGLRAFLTMRDYLAINQLEGLGVARPQARLILERMNSA